MSRPPVRKSVRGGSTPYVHATYEVFGSMQLAVLWQQVDWLSEDYGDEEGWAFWSISELARTLGPRESTVRGWLDKLLAVGAIERSDYLNGHGQHAWRPVRSYVLEANPRLSLRERRWDYLGTREGESRESREPVPPPDSDGALSSTRTPPRDLDVDVEVEEDNNNDVHVGSEERKEDNSRGEIYTAFFERTCCGCARSILPGNEFCLGGDGGDDPFHPACVREGVAAK